MEFLFEPQVLIGLATLILLEIILGIDNLVFIAILANRLPPEQRDRARIIGLSLALFMRLGLLASISWLTTLTTPLFEIGPFAPSGRDMILLLGGLFLLFKSTTEIHERLEGKAHARSAAGHASFAAVIAQIIVLDLVFSLDSIITAVGLVNELWVMMTAVIVAVGVMIVASKPLTEFVNRHPTVVMLCLAFLLMIGLSLMAEGFGFEIPKGYLYAAIAFSILVETFNQIRMSNVSKQSETQPMRQRATDAVLRLLGGQPSAADGAERAPADSAVPSPFGAAEREMIEGVLRLGERNIRSIMTPRHDIGWLDLRAGPDDIKATMAAHAHSRYLVCDGAIDEVLGVVLARDVMPELIAGKAPDLKAHMHPPLVVHDRLPVTGVIERLKTTPTRLAVVVDEHGNVDGLVTPTDVLAAIAGELVEDEDAGARPVQLPDGSFEFEGTVPADAAALALDRKAMADSKDYSTVAGFVLWRLGRVPRTSESFEWEGWRFTVQRLDGHRIELVRAARVETKSAKA